MATAVYTLCALTSGVCAVLLAREYRRRGTRLLLWSSISFWGFTLSNALAFTDFVVLPHVQMWAIRPPLSALSIAALLYGLVWDSD
jgi:heme/copper-type cytochrome/quinol oxidase subunit 1